MLGACPCKGTIVRSYQPRRNAFYHVYRRGLGAREVGCTSRWILSILTSWFVFMGRRLETTSATSCWGKPQNRGCPPRWRFLGHQHRCSLSCRCRHQQHRCKYIHKNPVLGSKNLTHRNTNSTLTFPKQSLRKRTPETSHILQYRQTPCQFVHQYHLTFHRLHSRLEPLVCFQIHYGLVRSEKL